MTKCPSLHLEGGANSVSDELKLNEVLDGAERQLNNPTFSNTRVA